MIFQYMMMLVKGEGMGEEYVDTNCTWIRKGLFQMLMMFLELLRSDSSKAGIIRVQASQNS